VSPDRLFRILIILVASLLVASQGSSSTDVVIKNRIADCVAIERRKTSTDANLVVLDAALTIKKSSGECGCMSGSATYKSYIVHGQVKEILQQGQIRVLQGGVRKLVLASDASLVDRQEVTLELGCAPPQ
jgi:hypothetical protein